MKKIILASQSPQRRKLLKFLGLRFTVKPSRAAELHRIKTTCAALVMENARRKAEDVASRLKSGVVIGADTLVYADKKIIGKPRNLKEARRILKTLFSHPQWVYTGVAVVDVATGKTLVDYEKTKIFMVPLTDAEITHYHRRINPFDKAGGFQIEGW